MNLSNQEKDIDPFSFKDCSDNGGLTSFEVFANQEILKVINSKISILLSQEMEWETFIKKAIFVLGTNLNWRAANYWEVNLDKERIEFAIQWESFRKNDLTTQKKQERCRAESFGRGQGIPGKIWQSNKPIWNSINFARKSKVESENFYSTFGFPVYSKSEVIGVVEVSVDSRKNWMDSNLTRFLCGIGGQFGWYKKQKDNEQKFSFTKEDRLNDKNNKFNYLLEVIRKNKKEY